VKSYVDGSDKQKFETELSFCRRLLDFMLNDERFNEVEQEAPSLYEAIRTCETQLQKKIDVCSWSCTTYASAYEKYCFCGLKTLGAVQREKNEIHKLLLDN